MFESLDKSDKQVSPRSALLSYGVYCVLALSGILVLAAKITAGRRGVPVIAGAVVYSAALVLSVTWLVNALRSGPPRQRKFAFRMKHLMLLAIAPNLILLFRQ
jgi:hypothetical protein